MCVCELQLALKIYYPLNHHRFDVFFLYPAQPSWYPIHPHPHPPSGSSFFTHFCVFLSFLASDRQFNMNFIFMFFSHFNKKKNDPKKTLVLNWTSSLIENHPLPWFNEYSEVFSLSSRFSISKALWRCIKVFVARMMCIALIPQCATLIRQVIVFMGNFTFPIYRWVEPNGSLALFKTILILNHTRFNDALSLILSHFWRQLLQFPVPPLSILSQQHR